MKRHAVTEDPVHAITWPEQPTVAALGEAVGDACDLHVVVQEIPASMRHPQVNGLTVISDPRRADVFYDGTLSPLNRVQTILHEFGHILHGDVGPATGASHAARTMLDDPVEQRAEATGLRLLATLTRRQGRSEVFDFLTGTTDAAART